MPDAPADRNSSLRVIEARAKGKKLQKT